MIRILLIGNGAREHAIAEAVCRSEQPHEFYAYMSARNPGIVKLAKDTFIGDLLDPASVARYAENRKIDIAIVGPEAPLERGVADVLEERGIRCIGPRAEQAKLETSKSFTRQLMSDYNIRGLPEYRIFSDMNGIPEYLSELGEYVVKPDGLTGGKGVKVFGEHLHNNTETLKYCKEVLAKHPRIVIEEKLEGEEFSLQCLVDGAHVIPTPLAQDHKRAFEGDTGPNTGGMGSYSCEDHLLPFATQHDADDALKACEETTKAIRDKVGDFIGVLYGGFMITADGVKLIEYNVRFGDPEAMNVLPLMEDDFIDVCQRWVNGDLKKIEFSKQATVCKYAVPKGYPTNPVKGEVVRLEGKPRANIYYASVDEVEGTIKLSGSRAIAFVGIAPNIEEAEKIAQESLNAVRGPVFYRKDIGTRELLNRRVEHMKKLGLRLE
jgi:phosphoribosylamine--glycine ligase